MFIYILVALLPLFAEFHAVKNYRFNSIKYKKTILICSGIGLFCIIALRHYSVGSQDSWVYYEEWKKISQLDWGGFLIYLEDSRWEKGFSYSMYVLSHLIFNPQFVFVFTGLFFSITMIRFIYLHSPDVAMSMLMFITLGEYGFMVQGMRQAVAMCICLYALDYCLSRKLIRFLLCIFIATLFHRTAIVFVVMYFLYGIDVNFVNLIITFMGIFTFGYSSRYLTAIANQIFESNYDVPVESGGFIAITIYFLCIFAAYITKVRDNEHFSIFFYMTVIGGMIFMLRYMSTLAAERISFYFMFGQIIVLPYAVGKLNSKDRSFAKIVISLLCIALFAYRLRGSEFVPYRFFWQ